MEMYGLRAMPADQYHQHEAVGHSGLVRVIRSPAHFQHYVTNPFQPTPAMEFGTAVHTAVLEPERFMASYAVTPKFDRRTKTGKEEAALWDAENAGKIALTADQWDSIGRMKANLEAHAGAELLFSEGHAELSAFTTDPETGIEVKCRPDWIRVDEEVVSIVDLKTACEAGREAFARSIANFGYDVQAALYTDIIRAVTGKKEVAFFFAVVEKDAPHAVAVYRASDELVEVGREKYRGALQLLKWCRENQQWPGYQPRGEIESIDLPPWAANFTV